MLEKVIQSLKNSPIVKKEDYDYFVNPISDGVPAMDVEILNELTDVLLKHIDMDVDKIVAVEAMGIHLATALSLATGIPFVIIRKRQYGLPNEKKVFQETGYGSSNLYINDLNAGEKILLIDDVVSTGGTLISLISALKDIEVEIKDVVAIIDKANGRKIVEKETNVPVFSVVNLDVVDGKVVINSTIED